MTKDSNSIKSLARAAAVSVVTAGLIAVPSVALAEEAAPEDKGEAVPEVAQVEAEAASEAADPEPSTEPAQVVQVSEAETTTPKVTKAEVDAAKDEVDKADDAVNDASAALIEANKKADDAASAADQAAKDATDADAAARKDTADAKADADKAATDAAADVEKAESGVESAKSDVSAKTDAVTDATDKKADADQKVTDAKDAVDTYDKTDIDATQQKVDETKSDLDAKTDAATKADTEATSKENAATSAKDAYDAAVADQTTAKKAYDDAVAAQTTAANDLKRAEEELASAKANAQDAYDKKVAEAEAAVASAKAAKKTADDAAAAALAAKMSADAKVTSTKSAYDDEKAATEAAKKAAEEAAKQEAAKKAALEAAKNQDSTTTTVDAGRGTDTKYFVEDEAYTDAKQALYEAKLRLEAATTDREDNGIAAIFKQMALDESLTDTQRLYAYYAWASLMQNYYRGNSWDSSLIEAPDDLDLTLMNPENDALARRLYWNVFQDGQSGQSGTIIAGGLLIKNDLPNKHYTKYSDYSELMGQDYAVQDKLGKTDLNGDAIYDASHQVLYNASLKNNPINIEMLENILSYMQQVNDIRRMNGLDELKVDPRLMAEAAIRCLYSSLNDMQHHSLLSSGIGAQSENLASMNKFSEYANDGIAWPFSSWYTTEKQAYEDMIAKKGSDWVESVKDKYFNGGTMTDEESAFTSKVGHYLNLINPNTTSFGMSMGQASTKNGETVTDSCGVINFVGSTNASPFTVDEFVNLVRKYLSADYVNQIKADAASAQQAYNAELARLVSTSTENVKDAATSALKEFADYTKQNYGLEYGTDYEYQVMNYSYQGRDIIQVRLTYKNDDGSYWSDKAQAAVDAGWLTDEKAKALGNEFAVRYREYLRAMFRDSYYKATGDASLVFTTQNAATVGTGRKTYTDSNGNSYTGSYKTLTFELTGEGAGNTAAVDAATKAYNEAKAANATAQQAYKDQSAKEAEAKEAYDKAVTAAADAATKLDSANTAASEAATKLTSAEATLSSIKSAGVAGMTDEAEAAVKSAETEAAKADAAVDAAAADKDKADALVATTKAAYEKTSLAAKTARTEADAAASAKDKAAEAYEVAKAAAAEAYAPYQELLDAYDDALTDAAQADSDLIRANIELTSAKDKLADAEDALDAAQKAKAAADHMVELLASVDVDAAIKAGTTGYDELDELNAAFANAKDKAEAADALAKAAAEAKAASEKADAAYHEAADAYTKAYVNYLELKLAYEQAHAGGATDAKTDTTTKTDGNYTPAGATAAGTVGVNTASVTKPAGSASSSKLPTTGDASVAGETFVIGGITLVAAGVFLSEKKRRQINA